MRLVQGDMLGNVAILRHDLLYSWKMDWLIVPKVLEIVRYLVYTLEYLRNI